MNHILLFAKRIIYIVFFFRLIEGFITDERFSRYMNFVTGMLVIIMVLMPLSDLLNKGELFKRYLQETVYEFELENMKINHQMYSSVNEDLDQTIYRKQIKNQIRSLIEQENYTVKKIDLDICGEEFKNDYGKIEKISLYVKLNNQLTNANASKESLKIIYKKNIEKTIKDFYKLESDNIYVNVE